MRVPRLRDLVEGVCMLPNDLIRILSVGNIESIQSRYPQIYFSYTNSPTDASSPQLRLTGSRRLAAPFPSTTIRNLTVNTTSRCYQSHVGYHLYRVLPVQRR